VLPIVSSYAINSIQAESLATYQVPSSFSFFKSKKSAKLYLAQTKVLFIKSTKSMRKFLLASLALHVVGFSGLLYQQQVEFHKVIAPMQFTKFEIDQLGKISI
jgi:hypothetical protein